MTRTGRVAGSVGGYPHGRVPFSMREQQILAIARQLFATNGYAATGIADIARAAGVTRPVVYKHFDSKESIYLAVLRSARGELMAELTTAITSAGDLAGRVRAAVDAYFRYVQENSAAWQVLFGGGTTSVGPTAIESNRLRTETVGFIAEQIRAEVPTADPLLCEALAYGISGAAEQIAKWWRHHPKLDRDTVVDYQMAFTWRGLSALLPAPPS